MILIFSVRRSQNSNKGEKNSISLPSSHLEAILCLSEKLYCNWLIMLVTMATPISSHVKDKNSIFTARGEDMIF